MFGTKFIFFIALCPIDNSQLENGAFVSELGGPCLDGLCPTGTTHLYACDAGYNMNGSAFTTCLESDMWFPSIGNCEPEPWSEL